MARNSVPAGADFVLRTKKSTDVAETIARAGDEMGYDIQVNTDEASVTVHVAASDVTRWCPNGG